RHLSHTDRCHCGNTCIFSDHRGVFNAGDPFSHHHAAARLRTRDPFATLLKLPKERGIPSTYALGIMSTLTQPGEDTRVGTAGRIVVKGRVMRMVPHASGATLEWTSQKLDACAY
ncbi:unnamed protein product, partial [Scytosiphon promiscuus]